MEKLLGLFVDRGDLVHAISCVQAVRRLCENPAQASAGFQNRLQQFMSSVGTRERFEALTTMLNRQKLIDTDLLTRYLELMPVQAVVPMIELLGAINSLQGRRTVCDALAQLARDNAELLAGRLQDDRWYIVRNLIYVMGRIGGPRVVDYLRPLARHPESRVRRELVKTLDGMDHPKAVDALLDMLRDQEHTMRVVVLRALARRKSPRVVQPLSTVIADRHFAGKDLSEKLEVFVTLASSGEAEALALLTRYLRGTSWWRRAEQEQLRWCAAYALKQMGSAEALALLEEGSQGRDRHVQEACLAALRGTTRELMMRQAVS
jgi:HEAT repeat protein